tara:strand:- start:562 stop:804 length:243 start_codon:yes stop_codon:yes gene_type:complete
VKFLGKTHVVILFVIAFSFAVYIEIILINSYFEAKKYEKTHFPCTYISGTCTVKPTYKNCEKLNLIIPDNECERILNGRK